jgi:hypothetical protein
MFTNTTGYENVAVGKWCLYGHTTGYNNTSVGFNSSAVITTGIQNTALGHRALQGCTTGVNNTAVGMMAGGSNVGNLTTASNNAIFGFKGGQNCTSNANTALGNETNINGHDHAIVIGYNLDSIGNSHFTFGRNDGNDRVYNNFTSNASFTRVSDERYKKDIQNNTDCGLDFINDLRPVTFKWKAKSEIDSSLPDYNASKTTADYTEKMYGLIAQEVKSALEKHNITDFGGHDTVADSGIQAISQEMFIHPLIKAVQELSAQVTALQAKVATLEGA